MKRISLITALLAAGLTGLVATNHAASAQDADTFDGQDYVQRDDGPGGDRSDRFRDERRFDGDRGRRDDWGPRWRERDRGYDDEDRGPRWRRGDRYDDERGRHWREDERRGYGEGYGWRRHHQDWCRPERHDRYGWRHPERGDDGDRRHGWRDDRGSRWEGRGYGRDESGRDDRHPGGEQGRQDNSGPDRFGRTFDRLEAVKKEIGITAAQEQAWAKYASTMKEVSDARRSRREALDRSAINRMSLDDYRKFRDATIDQRRKEQDRVNAAVDELVNALDEKQAAVAREVLPGFALGGYMRGMRLGSAR